MHLGFWSTWLIYSGFIGNVFTFRFISNPHDHLLHPLPSEAICWRIKKGQLLRTWQDLDLVIFLHPARGWWSCTTIFHVVVGCCSCCSSSSLSINFSRAAPICFGSESWTSPQGGFATWSSDRSFVPHRSSLLGCSLAQWTFPIPPYWPHERKTA